MVPFVLTHGHVRLWSMPSLCAASELTATLATPLQALRVVLLRQGRQGKVDEGVRHLEGPVSAKLKASLGSQKSQTSQAPLVRCSHHSRVRLVL